jgi:hypothetical protein
VEGEGEREGVEREGVEREGVELTKHTTTRDRLKKCSEGILMTTTRFK